ncbi:hypothetical protein KCX83_04190 [Brucella oryzae]|uniref:hypothetical protein n=1 Tax=Brucella oryzae TaxID=335286 RepID=UPI001B8403CA|nr:hypothetical protein [Brucella oryzae]MBR7651519.1 hypothetical protein [Brucella oryzae]
MSTITITEMSDITMQWTSQGTRRDGLPEDHPTTLYGVWQDKHIIALYSTHDDASLFAELEADRQSVPLVDLVSNAMRMAIEDEWIAIPTQ